MEDTIVRDIAYENTHNNWVLVEGLLDVRLSSSVHWIYVGYQHTHSLTQTHYTSHRSEGEQEQLDGWGVSPLDNKHIN